MSDRLFSACCYGTDEQRADWRPCPQFVCAGCSKGPEHADAYTAAFKVMREALRVIQSLAFNAKYETADETLCDIENIANAAFDTARRAEVSP